MGLASEMMIILVLAAWGGLKLDEKLGLGFPLFVILLPLLGLGLILWQIIKQTQENG